LPQKKRNKNNKNTYISYKPNATHCDAVCKQALDTSTSWWTQIYPTLVQIMPTK